MDKIIIGITCIVVIFLLYNLIKTRIKNEKNPSNIVYVLIVIIFVLFIVWDIFRNIWLKNFLKYTPNVR